MSQGRNEIVLLPFVEIYEERNVSGTREKVGVQVVQKVNPNEEIFGDYDSNIIEIAIICRGQNFPTNITAPGNDEDARSYARFFIFERQAGSSGGSYGAHSSASFGLGRSIAPFNVHGNVTSTFPTSLQTRGQLYPSLKRIKLKNVRIPGRDVWVFRTSDKQGIYHNAEGKTYQAPEELVP